MGPPRIMGISALLNDASSPEKGPPAETVTEFKAEENGPLEVNESEVAVAPEKLFRSKIHPALLLDTKLVDIALRRKSSAKRNSNLDNCGSKLHRKSLEAGLRVKLVHSPSMYEIYFSLTPLSLHSKELYSVQFDQKSGSSYVLEHTDTLLNYRKNSLPQYVNSKGHTPVTAGSIKLESTSPKKSGKGPETHTSAAAKLTDKSLSEKAHPGNSDKTGFELPQPKPNDPLKAERDDFPNDSRGSSSEASLKSLSPGTGSSASSSSMGTTDSGSSTSSATPGSSGSITPGSSKSSVDVGATGAAGDATPVSKAPSGSNTGRKQGSMQLPRLAELVEHEAESVTEDTKSSSEDSLSLNEASTNPSDLSEGTSPRSSGSLSPQSRDLAEEDLNRKLSLFFTFGRFSTRTVSLIDSNIVDLSGVPWKVMKQFTHDHLKSQSSRTSQESIVSTFNNLDTAISSLFQVRKYSLVRITKCAATNSEGSNIVKLETARPGDPWLIDDGNFIEDMVTSLGKKNSSPSNLFIKKVVARPRYKVEMKLYFVPTDEPMSFYVDKRIYERDLINGVIDVESNPERTIFTNFPPQPIIDRVKAMIAESRRMSEEELQQKNHIMVHNHMTEDLHKYFMRPSVPETPSSAMSSVTPSSRASNMSSSSSSISNSRASHPDTDLPTKRSWAY